MPERVVFIDETSVKTNLTRIRGRSMRGTRLTASAPFGSWGTQTLIAGLSPSGLVAPWVIKGAMDGPAFVAYIRDVLIPEDEVPKEDRTLAKAVNFGLLFGAGATTLMDFAAGAYGVEMSLDEAQTFKRVFHQTYPDLTRWQREIVDTTNLFGFRLHA